MKKLIISTVIILIYFSLTGCKGSPNNVNSDAFKNDLEKISVPDMSSSILDANETDQLKWLADLYEFELSTMRTKTSGLSEDDLQLVETHLSQVFSAQESQILIEGFYQYNEEDKIYYVPDGEWFTYNERWPSSHLAIIERSDETVVLELTGVDDYGGHNQVIHYFLEIQKGQMILEKRIINQ